jgi:hypothetical protein
MWNAHPFYMHTYNQFSYQVHLNILRVYDPSEGHDDLNSDRKPSREPLTRLTY